MKLVDPTEVDADDVKDQFIAVLEGIGLAWEWNGERVVKVPHAPYMYPLPRERLKVTQAELEWKAMHIRTRPGDEQKDWNVLLGVQPENWFWSRRWDRLVYLVHEATHLQHLHHKPVFWDTMLCNLARIHAEQAVEERVWQAVAPERQQGLPEFNWRRVFEVVAGTVAEQSVDRRCETVQWRRQRILQCYDEFREFWMRRDAPLPEELEYSIDTEVLDLDEDLMDW